MYKKNILFAFGIFLIVFIIGFFNWFMDPYGIRRVKYEFFGFQQNDTSAVSTFFKIHKHNKYDYLVIGGSSAAIFQGDFFDSVMFYNKIAAYSVNELSASYMKELVMNFLSIHPETKTVVMPLDYYAFDEKKMYSDVDFHFNFNNGKLTLKELGYLFLSVESTQKSIKMLEYAPKVLVYNLENIMNRELQLVHDMDSFEKKPVFSEKNRNAFFRYYPERRYVPGHNPIVFNENFDAIKELINELQKRNINIIFYTFPYHANNIEGYHGLEHMNTIKKYIVEKTGIMYDMAFINKYTSTPFDEHNYLYMDVNHGSTFFGGAFYEKLLCNRNKYGVIKELNRENIGKVLAEEQKLIENYRKTHKKEIAQYKTYPFQGTESNYNNFKENPYRNMPKELKAEMDEMDLFLRSIK